METVTKNLENDHVQILRLIDVMEHLAKLPNPDAAHLEEVVFLIRNFADVFHHAKEENMLFPLLISKGFSPTQGPVAVMLSEHIQGRAFVKGMDENLSHYKQGEELKFLPELIENMKGYIELLRTHIAKENNVLFPMASKILSSDENQLLLKNFKDFESNSICGGVFENCIGRLDNLASTYKF